MVKNYLNSAGYAFEATSPFLSHARYCHVAMLNENPDSTVSFTKHYIYVLLFCYISYIILYIILLYIFYYILLYILYIYCIIYIYIIILLYIIFI